MPVPRVNPPLQPRPGRRSTVRSVVLTLALLVAGWPPRAMPLFDDSEVAADARTPPGPAAIVLGIVRYTRWPGDPDPLRLCVSQGGATVPGLREMLERGPAGSPRLQLREISPDAPVADDCAIVLFEGWRDEPTRQALRTLAGRPVLTIGWNHAFCTDGGMFCLEAADGRHRFEVNLDVVARSRLRVHPQVLWLARPKTTKT